LGTPFTNLLKPGKEGSKKGSKKNPQLVDWDLDIFDMS
jgi:hypothetical protein